MIVMVMASPSSYVTVIVSPSLDELDVVPSCAGGVVGAGAGVVGVVEVEVQVCEVVVVLRDEKRSQHRRSVRKERGGRRTHLAALVVVVSLGVTTGNATQAPAVGA